jgi:hypothetical protein
VCFDFFKKFIKATRRVRSFAEKAFIENHANGPEIDFGVVALGEENLWCHVQRRTSQRAGMV